MDVCGFGGLREEKGYLSKPKVFIPLSLIIGSEASDVEALTNTCCTFIQASTHAHNIIDKPLT